MPECVLHFTILRQFAKNAQSCRKNHRNRVINGSVILKSPFSRIVKLASKQTIQVFQLVWLFAYIYEQVSTNWGCFKCFNHVWKPDASVYGDYEYSFPIKSSWKRQVAYIKNWIMYIVCLCWKVCNSFCLANFLSSVSFLHRQQLFCALTIIRADIFAPNCHVAIKSCPSGHFQFVNNILLSASCGFAFCKIIKSNES